MTQNADHAFEQFVNYLIEEYDALRDDAWVDIPGETAKIPVEGDEPTALVIATDIEEGYLKDTDFLCEPTGPIEEGDDWKIRIISEEAKAINQQALKAIEEGLRHISDSYDEHISDSYN